MKRPAWIIVAVVYMGLIAFFSLHPKAHPEGDQEKLKEVIYNIGHIPAYALLCYMWINVLGQTDTRSHKTAVVIAVIYGILMEAFQAFCPGRYPSLTDILSNTSGALVMFWIYRRHGFSAHP